MKTQTKQQVTWVLLCSLLFSPGLGIQSALADPPEEAPPKTEAEQLSLNPYRDLLANVPVEESSPMIQAQDKRYALLGLSPEQVMKDPYFVDPSVQWGEVVEERDGKPTHTITYEFGNLNEEFGGAPRVYSLDKEVSVSVEGDKVFVSLEKPLKGGKTIFRRVFRIPGVQGVSKTSAFLKLLLKNGEIRTVVGANSRLFQFSEMADGGSLLVATTNVLTNKSLYDETGLLKSDVGIRNHDSRNTDSRYETPALASQLRYGDVEITLPGESGSVKVVDIDPLGPTADAVLSHLELLEKREAILNAKIPLQEILQAQESVAKLAQERPEIIPVSEDPGAFMRLAGNANLSPAARRSATAWKESPAELPEFESPSLKQMKQFAKALQGIAKDPNRRSTYSIEDDKAVEGTREAKLVDDASDAIKRANELSTVQLTNLNRVSQFLQKHQNTIIFAGSFAFLNAVIYMIPSTPFFLESRLINFDWGSIHSPFTGTDIPIRYAGPHVPYIFKFWLLCAGTAATTFFAVPMSFAYLSEKIIGRTLPRGRTVGMRETLKSGWTVFTTFGLRLSSYLLISWRDATVRLIANSVPGVRGQARKIPVLGAAIHLLTYPAAALTQLEGLPRTLQAMRYGQSPAEYLSQTESHEAPLLTRLHSLIRNIRGTSGIDPAQVQGQKESLRLLSYETGLFITLKVLSSENLVTHGTPMDALTLRRELGEGKYANLEASYSAISEAIYRRLLKLPAETQFLKPAELMAHIDQDPAVRAEISNLRLDWPTKAPGVAPSLTMERVWSKLAGNNSIFFRFRNGEASPGMVTVWSANFKNDVGTHPVWMGATPGDDAFASTKNAVDLMASDQGVILGIAGTKATVEQAFNVFAWIGNIPTDELTYGDKQASTAPQDLRNPNRITDANNPLYQTIRSHNNSGMLHSLKAYSTWTFPWHPDFWQSWERLGGRITKDQLRTWKNFLISGTVLTFAGILMNWSNLPVEHQITSTAFIAAGVKTLLFNTYAYMSYRIFWMGHSIGVRNMESEPEAKSKQLMELVAIAREELIDARESGQTDKLKTAYERLAVFYHQEQVPLPEDVARGQNLFAQADALTVHALANPPFKTAGHPFANLLTNQLMTGITTLIGTFGSALAWKYAFDVSWMETGALLGGLYMFGRSIAAVGGNVRAHLTYRPEVRRLRESIEKVATEDTPDNRRELFEHLLSIKRSYDRYGKIDVVNNNGFVNASPSSPDLLDTARHVYKAVLDEPVADNIATRAVVRAENALCADKAAAISGK